MKAGWDDIAQTLILIPVNNGGDKLQTYLFNKHTVVSFNTVPMQGHIASTDIADVHNICNSMRVNLYTPHIDRWRQFISRH